MTANNHQDHWLAQDLFSKYKQALIIAGFEGNICDDVATRIVNATDNSIYELKPRAVLQPKTPADIGLIFKVATSESFSSISFSVRGGGTGTNGQALTAGVVIDITTFMDQILEYDSKDMSVIVQPGVILSKLNQYLAPRGVFFAPHVSTADRATIGGMIATDAAGKGSLIYGKTNDHILELEGVLSNGEFFYITNTKISDNLKPIYSKIYEKLSQLEVEIDTRFPTNLVRPLSGYNLKAAITKKSRHSDENNLDLSKLIIGSEGTLAVITKARLKVLPIPMFKVLIVVHYAGFLEALADAKHLGSFKPVAIEVVDERVQASVKLLADWSILARLMGVSIDDNVVSNFIEIVAATQDELDAKIRNLETYLSEQKSRFKLIRDTQDIAKIIAIRARAVGLVSNVTTKRKPVAFVEDTLVPVDRLSDFIRDFRRLLDQYKLEYAMYGHVDAGCIHVRPLLDMQDSDDQKYVKLITDDVVKLVISYGGVLWGEHGKGFRGESTKQVYGNQLYQAMVLIKQCFDPKNKLNRGKLVVAPNTHNLELVRLDQVTLRGNLDNIITKDDQDYFLSSMLCNGNAACFNQDSMNVMCPSYKATKDRVHSPKGRAMIVKEWLRVKAQSPDDYTKQKQIATEVFDALEGCLGCNGCVGKCPVRVSIPELKTKFYAVYFKIYTKRSISQTLISYTEHMMLRVVKFPNVWNFLIKLSFLPKFGMVRIPKFSDGNTLKNILKHFDVITPNTNFDVINPEISVIIVADVFNSFFDYPILVATYELLTNLGLKPLVLPPRVSGKALLVNGMLEEFKKDAVVMANYLNKAFASGLEVISLESSLTEMYNTDYASYGVPLDSKVDSLGNYLSKFSDQLTKLIAVNNSNTLNQPQNFVNIYVLPHCIEQSLMPSEANFWVEILAKLNYSATVLNLGCCGMAGGYGHLKANLTTSKAIFAINWQNKIINDYNAIFLVTGYSCRTQVKHLIAQKIKVIHPVVYLNRLANQASITK